MMRRTIVFASLTFICTACGPTISVSTDWDQSFAFSDLNTYAWALQTTEADASNPNAIRVQRGTDRVLQERGFRLVENDPSFLVAYQLGAEDRQRFVPYNQALLGARSTARVEYTANTIVIDVIDPGSNEVVWRGSGETTPDANATVEQQSDLIRQVVEKILKDFPPDG
jgi:hypothetical protein